MVDEEKLKSLAYRLRDLSSLRNLFAELNYDFVDEPVNKQDWSETEKNTVTESRIIAKKDDYLIYYIQTNTDSLKEWKGIATRIIKQRHGLCLVCSHNPSGFKWVFSSISKEFSKSFSETRHIPVEIRPDSGVPKSFIEFLEKIEAKDNNATSIAAKVSEAFDNFAVQIHDELTINVFEALKVLTEGIVRNELNKLPFSNEILDKIREPIFILLYRIMFVLYAEDRGIFPTDQEFYYNNFSLKRIKHEWLLKPETQKKLKEYEAQELLRKLFRLIELGSEDLGHDPKEFFMRSYYGRLFDRKIYPDLEKWKISNKYLLDAISLLTRTRDKKGNYFFLDYAALETRHLGSIYEHLLEYHLTIKGNKIADLPDPQERKTTGSYYTPAYIVDYIVNNTIGPIIDKIINQTITNSEKIDKILSLNILDPAMGSGHFLVGAMNYIARRICEIETDEITEQQFIERKRDVARRCIYGVDLNQLAVDLAMVSLWLETLSSEKPLSFLSAHLKCGNSLIGSKIETLFDKQTTLVESQKGREHFKKSVRDFLMLEILEDDTPSAVKTKVEKYRSMQSQGTIYYDLKFLLDCKTSESFGIQISALGDYRTKIGENSLDFYSNKSLMKVKELSDFHKFFHWELEFPDIFYDANGLKKENSGFDAIIGNPPYVDSEEMTKNQKEFRDFLSEAYTTTEGNWDLYIPFFERAIQITQNEGLVSFITPNKWLSIGYGHSLRKMLTKNLSQLSNCDEITVFKDAGNSPVISFFKKDVVVEDIKIDSFSPNFEILKRDPVPRKILELDNWGILISKHINTLVRISNQECQLSDFCGDVENPFTVSEAYKLTELIYEGKKGEDNFKLINTGTIDPFETLWGKTPTSYIKQKYLHPYVRKKELQKIMPKRFEQSISPKLIITGIRYFESFLDEDGSCVAGKSTIIIRNPQKISLRALYSLLNSRLITFYMQEAFRATGIGGGVNFNSTMIEQIPVRRLSSKDISTLEKYTDKILACIGQNKEAFLKILDELNKFIYDIYGLQESDIRVINEVCA